MQPVKVAHSGGAKGADTLFSHLIYTNYPHIDIIHHSFTGHKLYSTTGRQLIHSDDELYAWNNTLKTICGSLDRKLPSDEYIKKLLLRNIFQIKDTESVIGIGPITDHSMCIVGGGTGYAVKYGQLLNIPMLVYNLVDDLWYYSLHGFGFQKLNRLPEFSKFPSSITCIGSRKLSRNSLININNLFTEH